MSPKLYTNNNNGKQNNSKYNSSGNKTREANRITMVGVEYVRLCLEVQVRDISGYVCKSELEISQGMSAGPS